MWNSLLAVKNNLLSLKFNLLSSIRHFLNSSRLFKHSSDPELKLHFGCGIDYKKDWLNLDVNKVANYWIDVRNPVKIKDSSCEYIYSSHMIEHLEHHEVIFHLKECHRML